MGDFKIASVSMEQEVFRASMFTDFYWFISEALQKGGMQDRSLLVHQ